ncbi:MAG: shikimate dehydrogenase family protein [Gemmatimonadaceae bacterium]
MIQPPGRLLLLGHPVAHSLSPAFQNAALASAGVRLRYEAMDIEPSALAAKVDWLVSQRAAGNVTIPHKERMAELCTWLTPLAARVGAVNVFWTEGGTLCGDNTDVGGFAHAARELLGAEPRALRIALLGAGGTAAAVLAAAERWPACETVLHARGRARAQALADRFPAASVAASLAAALDGATFVVNATPVGIDGCAMPTDPEAVPRDAIALDVVYRRDGTQWTRALRERGLVAGDGLTMLIEQGALAFERWLGFPPDREVMRRAAGRE